MKKIKVELDLEDELMQSVLEGRVEAVLSCLERGNNLFQRLVGSPVFMSVIFCCVRTCSFPDTKLFIPDLQNENQEFRIRILL